MLYYLDNPQSITYSYPVSLLKDPLFSDSSRQPFITSDLMPTHYQKANVNSVGIPNNLVIACYYDSKNSPNCYPNAVQVRTCEDKGVTNMIRFNYKDKGYFYNSYFGRVLNYDGGQPSC
jgi:hypothetical protein